MSDRPFRVIEMNLAVQLLILLGSVGAVGAAGYAALSVLQNQVAAVTKELSQDRENMRLLSNELTGSLKEISRDIAGMRVEIAKAGKR